MVQNLKVIRIVTNSWNKYVEAAIKLPKVKYASNQFNVLWFFNHSSGHTAFAEDALNASCMNVKPGGKSIMVSHKGWS